MLITSSKVNNCGSIDDNSNFQFLKSTSINLFAVYVKRYRRMLKGIGKVKSYDSLAVQYITRKVINRGKTKNEEKVKVYFK